MTEDKPHTGDEATPSTEELREQVEATREELGETVEALAAKADVKARAQEKTDTVKQQVEEKTTQAKAQLRDTAAHVVHVVQEKTPEPVREKAGQGLQAARANRAPLLAAAGALIALLFIRRSRKHR
ncbi:DUF3618 domain-containing protein [Streptomyces prunicolor]|uniref:DUF3618 domain-containing protein n=1 Tax=Streptomyces prunicolor TaxID=67348 RepID=UPI002256B111|nr:DUF3618 domain-containing protein [Streptomyces prunicolor]MCX5238670.1 DUF3618 domain-containing protein [Streptomyces prunicolor]